MFYLTQCLIFPSGLNQLVKLAVVEAVERKQRDQAAGPSPGLPQTTATRRAHARPARLGRRSDGAPFAGGGATS